MAGRGPAPKAHRQRERDERRRDSEFTEVWQDGVLRGPDLAEATGRDDWSPMTVAWYENWRKSPQAQVFEDTDWQRLITLVPLVEYYWTADKPSAAAMSEIRLNEERLGATYVDRQRMRVRIVREDSGAAGEAETAAAARRARDNVRMRVLRGGGADA